MSLSISKAEINSVTVVRLNGRIVFGEEANSLRHEVKPLVQTPGAAVVIDLKDVSYVDSGGIGALVGLYTTARANGGQLRLAGANDRVTHVLQLTKLADILGMFPTAEDAAAAIRRSATA